MLYTSFVLLLSRMVFNDYSVRGPGVLSSAEHEHWRGGAVNDAPGDAAQDEPSHRSQAPATYHYQVRSEFLREVEDLVHGRSPSGVAFGDPGAPSLYAPCLLLEQIAGSSKVFVEYSRVDPRCHPRIRVAGEPWQHVNDVQLGACPLREVCRRAGCQRGVFGAVGGQQNLSWKALHALNLLLGRDHGCWSLPGGAGSVATSSREE